MGKKITVCFITILLMLVTIVSPIHAVTTKPTAKLPVKAAAATFKPLPAGLDIEDIACGNNVFLLTASRDSSDGKAVYIYSSINGRNWVFRKYLGLNASSRIMYDNRRFVIWGSGRCWASVDGVTWSEQKMTVNEPEFNVKCFRVFGHDMEVVDMSYNGHRYVAVGNVNGSGPLILESEDGTTWNDISWEQIAINEPGFGIFGEGKGYTFYGQHQCIKKVLYGNNCFIAASEIAFYRSEDGVNWDVIKIGNKEILEDIACGNGVFLAVGWQDSQSYDSLLWRSTDGKNWTRVNLGRTFRFPQIVTFSNGNFTVVDDKGNFLTSANGMNWTKMATGKAYRLFELISGKSIMLGRLLSFPRNTLLQIAV